MDKIRTFSAKALCALLGLVICAAALVLPARAETYRTVLIDELDFLTDEEEREIYETMQQTAQNARCNLLICIGENIAADSERKYTEMLLDVNFGADSSSAAMFLATNTEHNYDDWVCGSGKCDKSIGEKSDEVLTAVYKGLDSGGWKGAAFAYCAKVEELMTGSSEEYTAPEFRAQLTDYQGILSAEQISALTVIMEQTANDIGCNVGVVITDDLGGKSDRKYADDFLGESFGFGANAIVLLFNNDRSDMSYIDWISTCGDAQEMYNHNVDIIFDRVYDALGKDDYFSAIGAFCDALGTYKDSASDDYVYDPVGDTSLFDKLFMAAGTTLFSVIVTIVIVSIVTAGYKRKKAVSTAVYLAPQHTRITHRSDVYLREFTTCVSSSSSGHGGGHSGGGGHHSSSHSSHGGGGGRRR